VIEAHRLDVERAECPHRVTGEPRRLDQFLRGRRPAEPLGKQCRGSAEPIEVGRSIERHPDRTAVTRDGRLNRLPDPPDGVGDELDAPVRIELPRGGHQAQVPLPDEIHERDPAVLELLGHRDDETHVVPRQLLLRFLVTTEGTTRQRRLFLHGEQGNPADLLEIEIQALAAFVDRSGELGRAPAPGPAGPLLGWHLYTPIFR
jgi:hypothetical protein